MSDYSEILYAELSTVEGVGRVIDMGGTMIEYNYSPTPETADMRALRADALAVASDAAAALRRLADEIEARSSR
jgi:hypothetical protein